MKVEAKVRDIFQVSVQTNFGLLYLKPKSYLEGSKIGATQFFNGEVPLDATATNDGRVMIPISKDVRCREIGGCNVEFEYDGEFPEIPEEYVPDY